VVGDDDGLEEGDGAVEVKASTRSSTSSVQRGPSIGELGEEKREHGTPNLLVLEKRGYGEYGVRLDSQRADLSGREGGSTMAQVGAGEGRWRRI
jgi:hypothetical protein